MIKIRVLLIFLLMLWATVAQAQTRILTGKVIDNNLNPLPEISIFNADTVLLGKTDQNGNFNIAVPSDLSILIVAYVAMEWKLLDILSGCTNLEIILQYAGTYDFMSPAKVDRLRRKEFGKLPGLHQSALEKGVFQSAQPCYTDKFISHKKQLKEIHKARAKIPGS